MLTLISDENFNGDILRGLYRRRPDLDVVTFEGGESGAEEVRTYAQLWSNANRLAAGLLERGTGYGERFAILLRNHPQFIELMIAASLTGLVFVPIDPRTKGAKLAYTLNNSGCRGIVCADYSLAQVGQIRGQVPSLDWVWVLESGETLGAPALDEVSGAAPLADVLGALPPAESAVASRLLTDELGYDDPAGVLRALLDKRARQKRLKELEPLVFSGRTVDPGLHDEYKRLVVELKGTKR